MLDERPPLTGPDGEKIVDRSYYDLLGIEKGDADELAIKKAYRKQAIIWHPDKNVGKPEAAERFQEISEAYAVLSDSNLRAVYNKQGKKQAVAGAGGEQSMPDPGQLFNQMFGGKAFEDWVGEIALGKDVSKAFEMTEQDEAEAASKGAGKEGQESTASPGVTEPFTASTTQQGTLHHQAFESASNSTDAAPSTPSHLTANLEPISPAKAAATTSTSLGSASAPPPSASSTPGEPANPDKKLSAAEREKKAALAAEQEKKTEIYNKQRIEEQRERIRVLTQKLKDRVRPFVEASTPGDANDPETKRYADRIRQESQDLAMESFGVEICQLIGEVYMQKAASYIKLHRKPSANLLGVPGWWSRVKEKGTMLKEGWSFLSVGLDVQSAMADMEKRQARGELGEDEMKTLEQDLSGKLLLVAWKGSKFELASILRQVVDGALSKESSLVTDVTIMNRAKAILLTGAILKSVQPDETDVERRELERMVAEASRKRKERGKPVKKGMAQSSSISTPPGSGAPTPAEKV